MNEDTARPEEDDSTVTIPPEFRRPDRIGPYKIVQQLGEGGMGVVYLAEQEQPIRRRVALKLIKLGMDTKAVIGRFEAERQALALMNHPNVARVLEAGATEQGRPYFVMEYVKGVPITEHCDRQRLTTTERLELFLQVCDGVQHAHQKGIIHRDIKPSNVLVAIDGEKAVSKIIDFGIAKATDHRLTERTVFTRLGQIIGTPEYMSPEQAEMTNQDIDTRTDVYSLGVVLYELLAGALPFDSRELRRAGFDEIRRRIREDEPSKPSVRVGTLGDEATDSAKSRRTDPAGLRRQLKGDLDWITMKALAKDRTRRFSSVSELAQDIARHNRNEPVASGPPTATYRLRKTLSRHRGAASAVGVIVLLLSIGLVVVTGMYRRAESFRLRETAARSVVRELLLTQVSPPVTIVMHRLGDGDEIIPPGTPLEVGDRLQMELRTSEDMYFYVFARDDDGRAFALFPLSASDLQNPLPGGQVVRLPGSGPGGDKAWVVDEASAREQLLIIGSPSPLDELEELTGQPMRTDLNRQQAPGLRSLALGSWTPETVADALVTYPELAETVWIQHLEFGGK